MPSNVKDVPSTDSEVKLSSYGTSPPIPQTNRTYLGPHDITKKKDFLRQLHLCVCVFEYAFFNEMWACMMCMLCMIVRFVCTYVCVYVSVFVLCIFICILVCMFVLYA